MKQYIQLVRHILGNGKVREDRTGVGTIGVFGYQTRFDLSKGFPLLTTKKVFWKGVVHELIWFLRGDTNIRYLVQNGVHIWDDWPYQAYVQAGSPNGEMTVKEFAQRIAEDSEFAEKRGECGPLYGAMWRRWPTPDGPIDQLALLVDGLRKNPCSRRHIVSAWNPAEINRMILPPCHTLFQFYVQDGKLSCQLYQRSLDVCLGAPFNIASYTLLVHLVAKEVGLIPGKFVYTLGDAHIYKNHIDGAREQIHRKPLPLPTIRIASKATLWDVCYEDIELVGYQSHPPIKFEVAV